jgi:hypothetical protein
MILNREKILLCSKTHYLYTRLSRKRMLIKPYFCPNNDNYSFFIVTRSPFSWVLKKKTVSCDILKITM